jgi:AcrR family transcriptional regulator
VTSTREALSRDKVLDAALRLADEHGLGGLSMRKLAAELGVEAMSLYNHVTGKGDLLDGIAARVFEEVPLPDPALPWDERLRALGNATFATFAAHPDVVRALAANQANPRSAGALRLIDALLHALLDAGLGERAAARRYRSLIGLLYGSVLARSGHERLEVRRDEPVGDWFRRNVTPDELPSLHRALPALFDIECAPDFGQELAYFINSLS